MPIYVVIATQEEPLDADVERVFSDQNRYRAGPTVWFVRSPRLATGEVASDLEIKTNSNSGVVVTVKDYSGVTDRELVEKLSAWETAP